MERTEALVWTAAQGDTSAYRQLVDRYRSVVTSIAFARLRDLSASEDVAQEVFLQAWTNLGKLRNAASFGPWLRQTTRYHAAHHARAHARRPDREQAEAPQLALVPDAAPPADATLERRAEERVLADALAQLNAAEREVLLLYYREGNSISQVALLLELTETAVKKRLSRARQRLRTEVESRFALVAVSTAVGERFSAGVIAALPPQPPVAPLPGGAGWMKTAGQWALRHPFVLLGAAALVGLAIATFGGFVPHSAPLGSPTFTSTPVPGASPQFEPSPRREAVAPHEAATEELLQPVREPAARGGAQNAVPVPPGANDSSPPSLQPSKPQPVHPLRVP